MDSDGPSGLSGWLVLVCIGLILTPIRLAFFLLQTYPPIFRDGTYQLLTTPGGENYHPYWGPLMITEIAVNIGFIVTALVLLFLFFRKSWWFPKIYVALVLVNLGFMLVDAYAVTLILPTQPLFDEETAREFGFSVIVAMIWIPYMLISKRVKNTFVDGGA